MRVAARSLLFVVAAAVTLVLGVPQRGASAESPTITLRVMSFNIFYGGDELNLQTRQFCRDAAGCPETLEQVIAAIRASGADVVGLNEATMNTQLIADRLGWHASPRTQIISRYPLVDPPGANGLYVFVEPLPGRVVAVSDVHLPADPYGPYELRDGATLADVLELERDLRLPDIQDELSALPPLAARGIPVVLTGDFNSPSHLDWTQAVADQRDDVPFPVQWPVSKALANAGFEDSFRVAHPNPVARPGHTWTPGSPEGERVEVHDRIDWVLSAGPAEATESAVVGETGINTDIAVDPWPSDHRGIVSTFHVTSAEMPILVAVEERSLEQGETLRIRFHGGALVALVRGSNTATSKSTGGAADGTLSFATANLAPGAYKAILRNASGQTLSRSSFWLYRPGTPTTVDTSKTTYKVGEPIKVSWKKAPGMKFDWLGLYSGGESADNKQQTTCSAGYCGNGHYFLYTYTRNTIEGSTSFNANSPAGWKTWEQIGTGTYQIRLLLDDGYRSAAVSAPFKIVQP